MPSKMGGGDLLSVHLLGNQDLADVVLSRADGGRRLESGLVERVNDRFDGRFEVVVARSSRSDHRSLVQSLTASEPVIAEAPDVVMMSLDPDILQDDEHEEPSFITNMLEVVRLLKENGSHVLFVNASTVDPTEIVSDYSGRAEPFTRKAQRLDLALLELSIEEGISIVDVDRLIAEVGGDGRVLAPIDYSADACAAICDETLRILEDYGFFEVRPVIEQVGRVHS